MWSWPAAKSRKDRVVSIEADARRSAPSGAESLRETWNLLRVAAWPYRRQFAWVAFLALLGTGAGLIEPMIYRVAINDISGLFVSQRGERGVDSLLSDALGGERSR